MEKSTSKYPTNEQVKETLDAYHKGADALMELILERRVEEEAAKSKVSPVQTKD